MSARTKDYTIGYKRPPGAHRFKPGQSGNPRGRPKGRKNFSTLLREIVNRKVAIAGSHRKISMGEAVVRKLIASALAGDIKAQGMVIALMESHLGVSLDASSDPELCARERTALAQYLTAQGGGDEPDSD